jgi:SAM-dependent methyltransferase
VADAAAEAVLVAQAFHWFDVPAAERQIHRVLRPGGGLGIIYNDWDERVPWVERVQALVEAHRGDAPQRNTSPWREELGSTKLFTPLADREFPNVVHGSVEILLAHIASISIIAVLPERERSRVLDEVRALVTDVGRSGELGIPYLTHVTWCHAVAAPAT